MRSNQVDKEVKEMSGNRKGRVRRNKKKIKELSKKGIAKRVLPGQPQQISATSENVSSRISSKKEVAPAKPTGSIQSKSPNTRSKRTKRTQQVGRLEEKTKLNTGCRGERSSKKPRVQDKKTTTYARVNLPNAPHIKTNQDQQPHQKTPTSSNNFLVRGFAKLCKFIYRYFLFLFRCLVKLCKLFCCCYPNKSDKAPSDLKGTKAMFEDEEIAAIMNGQKEFKKSNENVNTFCSKKNNDRVLFEQGQSSELNCFHRLLTCGIYSCCIENQDDDPLGADKDQENRFYI